MASHSKIAQERKRSNAIQEARRDFGVIDMERPKGALSIDELCRGLGLGHTAMREKMNKAVAEGLYEKLLIRSRDARGNLYVLPVYRKVAKDAVDRIR